MNSAFDVKITARKSWVDICKGIAIILMLFLHSYSSNNHLISWIHSFLMPLFFILSGYVMSITQNYKKNFLQLLKKLFYQLMIPYFIWSFLTTAFLQLLKTKGHGFLDAFLSNIKPIVCLYGSSPAWFLSCLFVTEIVFIILLKTIKNKYVILGVTLMFVVGSFFLPKSDYTGYIGVFLRGTFFLWVGLILPKIENQLRYSFIWICFGISLISIYLNYPNGMIKKVYTNFGSSHALYMISALSGSFVFILFAKALENNYGKVINKIKYIGENTIIILCTHIFIVEIVRLLDYKLFQNVLLKCGIFEGCIMVAIILLCEIPVIHVGLKYTPFLFGKKIKKKVII